MCPARHPTPHYPRLADFIGQFFVDLLYQAANIVGAGRFPSAPDRALGLPLRLRYRLRFPFTSLVDIILQGLVAAVNLHR